MIRCLQARRALDPPQRQLRQQQNNAPTPLRRQRLPNCLGRGAAHDAIQASARLREAPCSPESVTRRILSTYKRHLLWDIEQVFRTMKSQGFALEDSQIETPQVMAKLILAVLIAALRAMQLVYARSGTTGQKLADAMDEAAEPLVEILTEKLEGKTEKQKNPHAKGMLARTPG
jgi:hypothetical protein